MEKILDAVGSAIILSIIGVAFFAQFGGMSASNKWSGYVKDLEKTGVKCERVRQKSGPPHARKTYYVCDNGEIIKWWTRDWF